MVSLAGQALEGLDMTAVPSVKLNNGIVMPQLGFGTWQIFLNGKAENAVEEALKIGYRLIDTARIYTNEKGVGRAVRDSGMPREEIFVTTKLWGNSSGYDKALKAFDGSLERLGLDYVDLYLIHFPPRTQRIQTWQAMEEIYKSGRAKSIGASNYDQGHISEILDVCEVVPAVNQIELHIFNYREQMELVEFCKQQEIVLEAYSPLAQATRMRDPVISKIAQKHHKTYAQIMLRWCIQHGTVPIPKSSNPQRIRENFDVFDFELSPEDMGLLDELSK
jgi:diketogulonate reductase-like aldo/keto reductase